VRRNLDALALSLAALALASAACARAPERPAGIGRRVADRAAQGLSPSPDGAWLAFLDRCARPPGPLVPLGVVACDLEVVPATGGAAERVAEGVTSLPGGFAWSPDGKALAALSGYDHAEARGAAVLWRPGGGARRLAGAVGFYAFTPDGALGFVSQGQLFLARGEEVAPVAGATGVATFEASPRPGGAGPDLLVRRQSGAGGELLFVKGAAVRGRASAAPTGDYAFSAPGDRVAFTARNRDGWDLLVGAAGEGRAERVGSRVQSFAFSRDGSALAFLSDLAPGRPGDLWAVPPGAPAVRLGERVGEFRWASGALRLAWLQDFEARVRSGALAVGGPGMKPAVLGQNVTAYEISPDGTRVAFLEHVTAGGYSVDLKVAPVAEGARAATVARGVFGFDYAPGGGTLYYRAGCVRNAEACDLFAVPAEGLPAGKAARRIADGVKSFEFDRRNPDRLLLTWARKDSVTLDLAVWEGGKLTAVDQAALPGSATFLPPDSRRVAYVVADPRRAGVYVAELPR
jgi:hypothetical protein